MMHQMFLRGLSLTAVLALLLTPVSAIQAQEQPEAVTKPEKIELLVGDILELLPAHTLPDPVYTWILTQDRTFIQAGRAPNFRWRPIQTNTYTLIAEIQSGDGTQRIRRTFTIDVQARPTGQEAESSGTAGANNIVTTVPAPDTNGRVILPEHHLVLRLNPVEFDAAAIALDLDATVDSDQDGITTNDVNDEGTFFQSEGTPLHIWFASPLTTSDLNLTTLDAEGAAIQQRIQVASFTYAMEQGLIVSPVSISMQPIGEREYSFTGKLETPLTTPLLYHWTFGDGQESLLMSPTHTFAENGTYTIQLRVRNLLNGKEVAMQEQQISVESADTGTESSSAPSVEPDVTTGGGLLSARAGSILTMVGIFLLFVLFGALAVWIVSKFLRRGRSLPETIATMEETVLGTDKKTPPPLSIAPAVAQKQVPTPEVIAKREEDRATTNPVLEKPLKVDQTTAPSWLKKGLGDSPKPAPASTPASTPTPAKAAAPAPVKSPVTPPTASVPTPPKPAPMPPPMPKAATPTPPVPAPVVQPPVQPKPAPTPPPPTPPAPRPTPAPTLASSAPKPASVPTPAPVTPKPTPVPSQPVATPAPATPLPPKPVNPAPAAPITPAIPVPPKPAAPVAPPVLPKPIAPPVPVAPAAPVQTVPAPTPSAPPPAAPIAPVTPAVPKPTPTIIPPSTPASDQPIAIIRAESLEKKPNGEQAQA